MDIKDWFPKTSNQPVTYMFPNNGIVLDRLPEDIFKDLLQEAKKIELDFNSYEKYNSTLVGHIQNEFGLNHKIPLLENYIVDLCQRHNSYFKHSALSELYVEGTHKIVYSLQSLWINFQKKTEFNPIHTHSGLYSFVIWLQIPYDIEEEKNIFVDMSNEDKVVSNFSLYITDILGNIQSHSIELDKSKEGCICLFPSKMNHSVNPFYTSDKYRISISGNVYLKVIKVD